MYARLKQLHDASISDVRAGRDDQIVDVLGPWRAHGLIGDQRYLGLCSIRGAKQQLLDFAGTSIGIDPNSHTQVLNQDGKSRLLDRLLLLPVHQGGHDRDREMPGPQDRICHR